MPSARNDLVSLLAGSSYGGVLQNFSGTLTYYGSSYSFPTTSQTKEVNNTSGSYTPWNTQLNLTPVSTASGVLVNQGTLIARLVMRQVGSNISNGEMFYCYIYLECLRKQYGCRSNRWLRRIIAQCDGYLAGLPRNGCCTADCPLRKKSTAGLLSDWHNC